MRNIATLALIVLGVAQMGADVLAAPRLRGLAAATGASPAPKVFSAARGLETYSTDFWISFEDSVGHPQRIQLTPERYAELRGPYNRRNAYGAVLAYGPILRDDPRTREMFESVSRYALCGAAPLLQELGLDPTPDPHTIRIELDPRPGTHPEVDLQLEVSCS